MTTKRHKVTTKQRSRPTLLKLNRMDPSAAVGGASKEAGFSSSVDGEGVTGLVHAEEEAVTSLKPGLFGPGAVGERARLAYRERERECSSLSTPAGGSRVQQQTELTWSFSMRAEFLFALEGTGEVTAGGG